MKSVRIAFMGDTVVPSMPNKIDIDAKSEYLYDLAICNLEGSCRSSTPIRKLANLHSSPEALGTMRSKLGIRYVNLANNHVMDFGIEGIEQLTAILDDMDVKYFGAGGTRSEAMKPMLVCHDGIRFGFLGFSWKPIESVGATPNKAGVALIPQEDELCQAVTCLREKCDHVVVSFHWGYEYERYPLPLHRKLAHAVVDAGASAIIGHHPHVYQGIEFYKGAPIFYSLGNLMMPIPQKPQADIGMVPVLEFASDSVRQLVLLYSIYERSQGTLLITDKWDAEPAIDDLSIPLGLDDRNYERYFGSRRVRRKGLPVFTGSKADPIRYAWLDIRSSIVRICGRVGLR